MKLYKLHKHQQEALDLLRLSFRNGYKRPMLYASVALGKTVIAAHIVASALDKGKRVCFVVPFTVLINQTAKSFMAQGLPQPGIIQAQHEWTDPSRRLQIASIQTLSRRKRQDFDIYIIDEAHVIYREIADIANNTNIPFIGLSGSPFTVGLGKIYSNLIKAKPMSELIDEAFLSDYIAYAPSAPDMKGVRTVGGDFDNKESGERMSTPQITGSVVDSWLKLGDNEPTICFATNVKHANFLGNEFDKREISNRVITAKTPHEEREDIFDLFSIGEIKILINVGTLTTGMDKDVRCIIFARPVKSKILWIQMSGRGLRMADGKENAIFLDHGGNFERLGYPEDLDIDELDMDDKSDASKQKPKEKIEKLPKKCPSCSFVKDAGVHECPKCGFMPRVTQDVDVIDGELKQIKGKFKKTDKQAIYSELIGYQIEMRWKGRHLSDGWIAHTYKDMTGVWPKGLKGDSCEPSEATRGFIIHKQIAYSKSRK